MAATSTLLKLTPLQWNPPFSHTHRHHHHHRSSVLFFSDHVRKSSKLCRVQIAVKCKQPDANLRFDYDRAQIQKNPFDQIVIQIQKTLYSLKKPAIAVVFLGLLLFFDPNRALARSGGRIGGSAFSSRSSSSSSSSSQSWSSSSSKPRSSSSSKPRSSSYSSSSDDESYSASPSSSWSSSSARQKQKVHREPQTSDPSSSSWSSSSSTQLQTSDPSVTNGVSEVGVFMLTICLIFVVSSIVSSLVRSDRSQEDTQKTSVIKLQVGLLGSGRSLQGYFDRLAESADTSTSAGLSYVLAEATLALMRHPDFCISCYSSVDVKPNIESGELQFNNLSIEERGKFDEETLVNVDSIKRRSSKILRTASGFTNEYIVVTILVAAEGIHKLQPINGSVDLKEALKKLGSIPRNQILAVEVLWTPQDENEVLSERELLEDYPLLKLL